MKTCWIWLALLPASAFAQLQLTPADNTQWTQNGSWYQASLSICDSLDSSFKVTNSGTSKINLTSLTVAGAGFSIPAAAEPSFPYALGAGQFWNFDVRFTPNGAGSYSATLQANGTSVTLYATVSGSACLSQNGAAVSAGATLNFGKVASGATATQSFTLSNRTSAAVRIATITVTGSAFQGPLGVSSPLTLQPGQSIPFQIVFSPVDSQQAQGMLTVGQSSFPLIGLGLNPPLPAAALQISPSIGTSAQQGSISIALASPAQSAGTGTLTMTFQSSVPGVTDDPAIQFLSGARRNATVTVSPGDTLAEFGTKTSLAFQTGTTAGTITFTLTLPGTSQQASVTIAPAPVSFDSATATRLVNSLNVSLTGYDNTYSASQLSVTFYSQSGQAYPFPLDLSQQFATYFKTAQAGGAFALLAQFPVTQGDSSTITSADVAVTNSAGASQTRHITF